MCFVQKMSALIAPDRPFKPTVHIIILPSQIPLDLRMHFRDLDESQIVSLPKAYRQAFECCI